MNHGLEFSTKVFRVFSQLAHHIIHLKMLFDTRYYGKFATLFVLEKETNVSLFLSVSCQSARWHFYDNIRFNNIISTFFNINYFGPFITASNYVLNLIKSRSWHIFLQNISSFLLTIYFSGLTCYYEYLQYALL